MTGISR